MKIVFMRTLVGGLFAGASLLGAFAVAGTPAASAQAENAQVRVIHASPDAPAVDVYVNGSKAVSNLAFKDVSPWTPLPAGTYAIKVTAAGQTEGVIEANLPVEAGESYSVVAVGNLANIQVKVVEDNLSALDGKARLQVVHASPNAPAVDVAAKGGAVLVPSLAFPAASGYLTVDPMNLDVEVRPAGTTDVALAVPGLNLEANKVYTVYAVGLLSGTPALTVLPVVDNAVASAASGSATAQQPTGMPRTGAADNVLSLAVLALILAALVSLAGGLLVRARNR